MRDHKPLKWELTVKDPSSRLLRWCLELVEYDFTIHYCFGKTSHADFLSRIHKIKSAEGEKGNEESLGHQQAGRPSGEGERSEVHKQA